MKGLIKMKLTEINVTNKGIIPALFDGKKEFFGGRLRIEVDMRLSGELRHGNTLIGLDTKNRIEEENVHSFFVMNNAMTFHWYDVAIKPIEQIDGLWKLSELDYGSIDYDAVAEYIYNLIIYISDAVYPFVNHLAPGHDPNAISYIMKLGDQIEAYIEDLKSLKGYKFPDESDTINDIYLSNTIRLIQELICHRAVTNMYDGDEVMILCKSFNIDNKPMVEAVFTNKNFDYLGIYTITDTNIVNRFVMPIIKLATEKPEVLDTYSIDEFKEYFSTLYSFNFYDTEMICTPLRHLRDAIGGNKVLNLIIINDEELKKLCDDDDTAKTAQAVSSNNDFKDAFNVIHAYYVLHKINPDKPFIVSFTIAPEPVTRVIFKIEANESKAEITNKEQVTVVKYILDDSTLAVDSDIYPGGPAYPMTFSSREKAIEWIKATVDFAAGITKKLIKYGEASGQSIDEWNKNVVSGLPANHIVTYLVEKMIQPGASIEAISESLIRRLK